MELSDRICHLKGIGEVRAKLFAKLGILTIQDLLTYYPRAYEDRTRRRAIAELEVGVPACFEAMLISPVKTSRLHNGQRLTRFTVADDTAKLTITFFNQDYQKQQLHYGQTYLFYGTLQGDYSKHGMTNPIVETPEQNGLQTRRIVPIYPLTAGLSHRIFCRAIAQALPLAAQLPDVLPPDIRAHYALCDAAQACRSIHAPESWPALEAAQRRIAFEEFFVFSAGLQLHKAQRAQHSKTPMQNLRLDDFYRILPFSLTAAQQRVINEILADFRRPCPMARLVQGDVGSGKTIIAAAALLCAVRNGLQSVLVAPTEILAEQHMKSLAPIFDLLGIRCRLLTGSMKESEKRSCRAAAQQGELDVLIGTHALFSDSTIFSNLGLVVTDEQHRFGVAQRAALSHKGVLPHLLLLSATPIPRTLSMILYGDLDVSILDERPPGRQPVDTYLLSDAKRDQINAFIRKQIEAGQQCYIVCPAVEQTQSPLLKSAETWAAQLQTTVFPDLQVALLHGQMKRQEKEAVMASFSRGEIQILVATTVIEVGIDIPNANLIVIENADRFGLSQLHQLRGRVGRSGIKSYCVLVSDNKNPDTRQRLKALCKTQDGFAIAEADLALRGPGDLFGQRQHGLPVLHCAGLQPDMLTLQQAQQAAANYLGNDAAATQPEFTALSARIRELFENSAELLF